jgi:hypothetical protein
MERLSVEFTIFWNILDLQSLRATDCNTDHYSETMQWVNKVSTNFILKGLTPQKLNEVYGKKQPKRV